MAWDLAVGAGASALGGLLGGESQHVMRNYSVPGIWNQGKLIEQMVNANMRGDGDYGFGQAVQQGTSSLEQMMRDRGFAGSLGSGGVGSSLLAQMMASAAGQEAMNRQQFGLQAAQAQPWVFNYQKKGTAPYGAYGGPTGANWNMAGT